MKIEEPCLHPSAIHPEICLERVLKDEVSLVLSSSTQSNSCANEQENGKVGSIKENFNRLISRYAPWIKRIPLYEQGLRFEPTWKALPTHSLTKRVWVERRKLPYRKIRNFRSSFTSFSHELGAFQWLLVVGHSQGTQWSHGCLWPPRIRYAFDGSPGKLGCTCEGAGKRRIFAIGNYVRGC
ncbi:hypothetical protein V8G54_037849 (chloroplast) [Vigna mungo]|uniref:Uncharacterized protein n=1 Tax=Vigna mungo TaxID=3915 RepID=A0AAQ3MDG3_VIGMU